MRLVLGPHPRMVRDQPALTPHLHLIQVGDEFDPPPDHGRMHRVVVAVQPQDSGPAAAGSMTANRSTGGTAGNDSIACRSPSNRPAARHPNTAVLPLVGPP